MRFLQRWSALVVLAWLAMPVVALAAGATEVDCVIDGHPWRQRPFPYQAKCLNWLRAAREALNPSERRAVDGWLTGTGCELLFA